MTLDILRAYQRTTIAEARAAITHGKRRILLCLPTGAGKTLTAGAMIHGAIAKQKRVLFVAHRKELIDQTVASLYRLGVHPVGVLRGSDRRKDLARPVQVASIQTLARRPRMHPAPDLVFIDECHRALAKGYQENLYQAYPSAIFVGLSATPCRVDGKPLRDAFDHLVQVVKYSELIVQRHIEAPLVYGTPMQPDLSRVSTSKGDYDQEELEAAVNRSALIGNIGAEWQKRHGGRRTVVFCVSVAHSQAVAEMFRELGVAAEHLDGTTPEGQRAAILKRLERSETQVVCNVGVLCEGWDMPACKLLVVARPTKSLSLWMQMAGRILRPWEGVQPIILDHGGNVDRHKLPHIDREWSLDPKPKKKRTKTEDDIPMRICSECFAYLEPGGGTCPHCGAERPPPQRSFEPVPVDLALRTIEGEAIAEGAIKKSFFMATYRRARDRGWLFGAVLHRFRERFDGEGPPPEWVTALKSDFRGDDEWKERVSEKRAARKALEAAALGDPKKEVA